MSTSAPQTTPLSRAIDDPDLRWTKFFNGRLLTGADLDGEQRSNKAARRLLGRSLGPGVACGLEVYVAPGLGSATQPVLKIGCGLALNKLGDVLELDADTTIALSADPSSGAASDTGFTVCQPGEGSYTGTTGLFLLTIGPCSSSYGRAPVSGLGNGGGACDVDYNVDGVQFQLIGLAVDPSLGDEPDLLRNRVAHLIFGTIDPARLSEVVDPFSHSSASYGLLDRLASGCLSDDCVPLALVHWTADGVTFLDRWAVRRRITAPIAADRWPTLIGDRRRAEAEAMFLQFEDQIEELLAASTAPQSLAASTAFGFLPPAGVVPIATGGGTRGCDPATFFGAQASTDVAQIDAVLVPALIHDSLWHEPIAVGSAERIQLYLIRDNQQAVEAGIATHAALVFAKATLSYRGIARFGVARFGRSRFAPRVI
jgi:hypothetical protein